MSAYWAITSCRKLGVPSNASPSSNPSVRLRHAANPPVTVATRAMKNRYDVAIGAASVVDPAKVQQRATNAETRSGYSGCVQLKAGDQARCGRFPSAARKRARRFQIDQASQLPCGFASQASVIALVAIAAATRTAPSRNIVNGCETAPLLSRL